MAVAQHPHPPSTPNQQALGRSAPSQLLATAAPPFGQCWEPRRCRAGSSCDPEKQYLLLGPGCAALTHTPYLLHIWYTCCSWPAYLLHNRYPVLHTGQHMHTVCTCFHTVHWVCPASAQQLPQGHPPFAGLASWHGSCHLSLLVLYSRGLYRIYAANRHFTLCSLPYSILPIMSPTQMKRVDARLVMAQMHSHHVW